MFNPTDWVDIMALLGLAASDKGALIQAMTAIENDSPELIPKIYECIANLKAVSDSLAAEQSSANSALIRADVLEWSEGNRADGMKERRRELRECLFNLLGLADFDLQLPGSNSSCIPGSGHTPIQINWGW